LVKELLQKRRRIAIQRAKLHRGATKVKTSSIFIAAFCIVLFGTAATQPARAQNENSSHSLSSLKEWKTTDEITFGAAILEVVSKNPAGAPAGLNLLMNGSQGVLYVNLGPNLPAAVVRSLTPGQVIQVVGIVQKFNGQNYLLARQLHIGDQTIEIRNDRGFLAHASPGSSGRTPRAQSGQFGGAR
jgi:hypothetical protein